MNDTLDVILVNRCNQSDEFQTVLPAKMCVRVLVILMLAAAAVLVVGAASGAAATTWCVEEGESIQSADEGVNLFYGGNIRLPHLVSSAYPLNDDVHLSVTEVPSSSSKIAFYSDYNSISDTSSDGLSAYADALRDQGYTVEQIYDPITSSKLDGCEALLVIGLGGYLSSSEKSAIEDFVENQDKGLLISGGPRSAVNDLAQGFTGGSMEWFGSNIVCDPTDYEVYPKWVKIQTFYDHPITENLGRIIMYKGTNIPAAWAFGGIIGCAYSDEDSWLDEDGDYAYDTGESRGAQPVLAYSSWDKIVIVPDGNVFDNSDADGDGVVAFYEYDNDVLGLNVAEWLAGAEEGEIKFMGTAIEYDGGMPGAPWGWTVSVDEMISGPQPCSNQIDVTTVALFQAGYIDPDIVQGDKIEVYGYYSYDQNGCSVSLVGSDAYYLKKADEECASLVKFKGSASTDESYGEVVCYGSYYYTVKVEEVLQDPDNTLVRGNEYRVCYGATQKNIKTGDKLEVFGDYYPTCGPLQCVGNIVASGDDYYVKIIMEEAVNFIGVVESEPSEPYDMGVRIDEIISDPEGTLSIGDLANIDIADDLSECDVVWPVHKGDKVEVFAKAYDYDCGLTSYDICVWIYSEDSTYDGYLKLVGEPDLIIRDISWSPSSPKQGDAVTFTVTIKNQGAASAGSSTIKYYIDGSHIGYDSVPALSAGSTSTQTFTWTANKCGNVQVKAVADANDAVDESDEGNNNLIKTVSVSCKPDLTITGISFSNPNPKEGEPITVMVTIKNEGQSTVSASFNLSLVQYAHFVVNGTSHEVIFKVVVKEIKSPIEPDGVKTIDMEWNAVPIYNIDNNEQLGCEVDRSNKVDEEDENNNIKYTSINVQDTSDFDPAEDGDGGYHFKNDDTLSKETQAEIRKSYSKYLSSISMPVIQLDVVHSLLNADLSESDGNCVGMSSTSILYHNDPNLKPVEGDTFYMMKESDVLEKIIQYQSNQIESIFWKIVTRLTGSDEEAEYEKIKQSLQNSEPMILHLGHEGWFDRMCEPFHAVVAINTYDISENIKNVVVYDPNYPGMATVIQFDLNSNKISYGDYTHTLAAKAVVVPPDLIGAINSLFKALYNENKNIVIFECPVNTTITDQYGRTISDDGINEIPGADLFIAEDTKIFYLPADLTYSTVIDAYDTGTFNFTRVSPIGKDISITKFENIPITASTKAFVEIVPDVTNYAMSIDYNGGGGIDETKYPDVNETIDVEQNSYTLQLHTGWNLISTPLVPEDSNIDSVFSSIAGNYSVVWTTTSTSGWKSSNQAFGRLTDVTVDKGYLIYMTAPDTLVIEGTEPASTTINLASGWNLVGYPSQTTRSITDVLSGVSYDVVWTTTSTGGWKSSNQAFGRLTDMSSGNGYMMYAPVSGSYTVN